MLAPEPVMGEALSSWFVRIAQANLLTVPECAALARLRPQALDRGAPTDLKALANALGIAVETLRLKAAWPSLDSNNTYGPGPPGCWAVCGACLQDDIRAGRPAHIRAAWTAPLAACCSLHHQPLTPHRLGGQDLIDEGQLSAVAVDGEGAWRHLLDLDVQESASLALLAKAAPLASGWDGGRSLPEWQAESAVLGECLDLVDALATALGG